MSTIQIRDPRLRRMVGIAGGYPPVIGDPYEEYPEDGYGDYPEMDSDPGFAQPGNIGPDPTMQPGMPPQQSAPQQKKPGFMRRLMPAIGDMVRGGIDAMATPNVALGGPVDMARTMQAAQQGKVQRDMQAYQMAYQQQQAAEMADYRRAQAEAARARAEASTRGPATAAPKQPRVGFDKFGNLWDLDAHKVVGKAQPGESTEGMVPVYVDEMGNLTEPPPGAEWGGPEATGWRGTRVNATLDTIAGARNSETMRGNANRARGTIVTGYDAQGNQVVTQAAPGSDGRAVVGEAVRTGASKAPPRAPGASRRVNTPARETVTQKVGRLAAKAINDARSNGANTYGEVMENVSKFYANDPEMAGARADVLKRLHVESQGQTGMRLPGVTDTVTRAESDAAAAKLSGKGAPAIGSVRYKNGTPYKFNGQEWVPQGR